MMKKYNLQKCWIWNHEVTDFVKTKMKGYTLNVPCGLSKLGDIRGDIDPKTEDIQKMDINNLPFPDNTFDTVIQDPPWKIDFFHRWKPFLECVRVCKPHGLIIYNAYWVPTSKYVVLKECFIRQDSAFTNASVICVFEKVQGSLDVDREVA